MRFLAILICIVGLIVFSQAGCRSSNSRGTTIENPGPTTNTPTTNPANPGSTAPTSGAPSGTSASNTVDVGSTTGGQSGSDMDVHQMTNNSAQNSTNDKKSQKLFSKNCTIRVFI